MIETIGIIIVWAMMIFGGIAVALFAYIGFMFFINWPK